MYDEPWDLDTKYFPQNIFTGFGINKLSFVFKSIRQGINSEIVVLSHINLLMVGVIIKLLSPKTKLVLIAHGIEVWKTFPVLKRKMLNSCDMILPVSKYTATHLEKNNIASSKIVVLNNCLDPYLPESAKTEKNKQLLQRYGFTENNRILLTLTRLSAKEKYKGYDSVIKALPKLVKINPELRYLIVGKFDESEKNRLDELIEENQLGKFIVFAGFVADEELAEHYNLADIYIMPSKKEGFGLVFIEAMFYSKPVIAGNKDGSADALLNGELGILINPDSNEEIEAALLKVLSDINKYQPDKKLLMEKFSYSSYKHNLTGILTQLKNG